MLGANTTLKCIPDITNTVCEEILVRINLRITHVQFAEVSPSTRTIGKHEEIVIKYRYLILNQIRR